MSQNLLMEQDLLMKQDLSQFIQPGRVHRQIYTDPAIFELELERIFGVAWIYVGHESQVKNPGDYFRTFIGRKPVVLVRDAGGVIRVIHNQCAHRGSLVVANDKGNAAEFQCCYHGWTYHLDGRLKAVPLQHGYPENFDPNNPKTAMTQMARVKSYRGFVFASEAEDGPSLEDFLGHMTTSLDDMIDRAPDGEVEIAGGVFRHAYDANWKLYLENLCDAAHPIFTHRSSIDAALAQPDDVHSDGSGEIAIRQMRQNGAPYSFWESQVGIWTYPNGHSYLGDYHDDAKLVAALKDPVFRDYIAAMEKKKGKAETRRVLEVRRWNSNVYPNLSFMSQFQQLRVVHPVAVNRTVVHTYNFRLKGAPEQMFRNTISFANTVNGTGSLVLTDDLEIYNRIGMGLVERRRRMDRDRPRLRERRAGCPRRTARPELDQRGLYSQHARCLARLYDQRPRRHARCIVTPADGKKAETRFKASGALATTDRVARQDGAACRHGNRSTSQHCEQFLLHEARLLDDGKFDDWLALFTPEAWYWVPSEPDQADPVETVSLIYDDRRLLETRVRRLASPRMYSQEPRSRTSRMIGNVSIEETRQEAPAPCAPNSS